MLIVGLGNPGNEYEKSRHNTGRLILEYIALANDFPEWKPARPRAGSGAGGDYKKLNAISAKGEIDGEKVDFLLPNTFMNNSGVAVCQLIDTPKKIKNLVVIYDDLDIPIGSLKISFNRSSGGHNGLESVIKKVKSCEFARIRIGISPTTPGGKLKKPKGEDAVLKFLLGNFKDDELKEIKKLSKEVAQIIVTISSEGTDKAMTLYN